ncbi:hypothetical protein [Spiribacter insolitus]|uniref:Uncharacterized protein n=1 Tax=Spiribacter insolitus TaxID=3122417 RepID=A0ABV3T587_9GAMM
MSLGNAPDYASIHHYYDPVEICFLCDYLRMPRPDALKSRQLEVRLDDRAGQSPEGFIRPVIGAGGSDILLIENCVARLALNAIEDRLPQWFARRDDGELVSSRESQSARSTGVPLLPTYLFSINWASTGPGLDWPEDYHMGYLPGFDVLVVTASQPSTDVYAYHDQAIGWFPAAGDVEAGIRAIIVDWWRAQASCLQERWEELTGVGLINGDAERWADEVWFEEEEEEEEEG